MRKSWALGRLTRARGLDILQIIGVIFMRERNLKPKENSIADEIMHVYRRLLQRSAQIMDSMNIGMGQVAILELLSRNGTMTQRQIADEIRVTPATICGTIKRMERAGLIRRASNERDGRVTCISLTEEGRQCTAQARTGAEQAHEEMLRGFTEEERRKLMDFVGRMGENLTHAVETAEEGLTDENR